MEHNPEVILALDLDNQEKAKYFVDKLYPKIKLFKVGIQLFTAAGPKIVEFINKKQAGVFLDLKLFDIPNSVAGAVRAAVGLEVKMLTLHILGDTEMLKKADAAAREEAGRLKINKPLLIGVTVLTSKETTSSDVLTLAKIGAENNLDGVVCSVREVPLLAKSIENKNFLFVTPGIRPQGAVAYDQKRTATISEAVSAGSNFLVIGRPILEAKDPVSVVENILSELEK